MRLKAILSLMISFTFMLWVAGIGQGLIQDGGFENQTTAELGSPWWINSDDGKPPVGSTIQVESGTGEAYEGNNNVKIVTTDVGQWIAIGQDLTVEKNTTYLITFYLKADKNIYWDGNAEWCKGYMKVIDAFGDALADRTIPHYYDGGSDGSPWTPGEIVFGGENMAFWRDYHYLFNSGDNTELYLIIGTFVNNVVTWRVDGFKMFKLAEADFVKDGGFENQATTSLESPWWIDTNDGKPPAGSTIEVEKASQSMEGEKNLKVVTTAAGQWIAVGQDFKVEPYTDYVFVFHLKGNSLYWSGDVEDCKGYMKIVNQGGATLADRSVPHYCARMGTVQPQFPGELIFGNELMMRYWRDYIYPFSSGTANEVYLFCGTYVNAEATWRLDGCKGYKVVSTTGVEDRSPMNPAGFRLDQNYPNPFNPTTTIRFDLIQRSETQLVIYNASGQIVRTLINRVVSPGMHEVVWNGTDDAGLTVPSGIYFYKLRAGNNIETKKLTFIR
ncbi:T9SS type A sorting domain-containing protein [candidate division KSB1 bacterium]|nr:T9SS type A sorting domain-containing protein [candidate division KSB1 bacterium]